MPLASRDLDGNILALIPAERAPASEIDDAEFKNRIVKELYSVDTSEPDFVHIHHVMVDDTGVDMGGHIWFERSSLRWVIDTLRSVLTVYAFPRTGIELAQDDLRIYESGHEQAPIVNLSNRRPSDAPHGGVYALMMSKPVAQRLVEELDAIAQETALTKLMRVGFFREMPHGDPTDPSLADARSDAAAPHQADLAAYLDAGHLFIATPSPGQEVFDRKVRIASPHYLTDGRYVWPGDVSHYVRKYNVRLPVDFLEHAMSNDWKVPAGVEVAKLQL